MNRNKYIIIDEIFPVCFSEAIQHSTFNWFGKITSAGFFYLTENEKGKKVAIAYGESVSLNLKSKPVEDSRVLTNFFFSQ